MKPSDAAVQAMRLAKVHAKIAHGVYEQNPLAVAVTVQRLADDLEGSNPTELLSPPGDTGLLRWSGASFLTPLGRGETLTAASDPGLDRFA